MDFKNMQNKIWVHMKSEDLMWALNNSKVNV